MLEGDKSQSERFLETARDLSVDLDEDQLRRPLAKLAKAKEAEKPKGDDQKGRRQPARTGARHGSNERV